MDRVSAINFTLRGHVKYRAIKLIHEVPELVLVIHRNDKLMASMDCCCYGKSHEKTSSVFSDNPKWVCLKIGSPKKMVYQFNIIFPKQHAIWGDTDIFTPFSGPKWTKIMHHSSELVMVTVAPDIEMVPRPICCVGNPQSSPWDTQMVQDLDDLGVTPWWRKHEETSIYNWELRCNWNPQCKWEGCRTSFHLLVLRSSQAQKRSFRSWFLWLFDLGYIWFWKPTGSFLKWLGSTFFLNDALASGNC